MKRMAILLLGLTCGVSGCNLPGPASVSSTPPAAEAPSANQAAPKRTENPPSKAPVVTAQETILGKWEPLNSNDHYEFLKDGQMRLTQGKTPPLAGTYRLVDNNTMEMKYLDLTFLVKYRLQKDELSLTYTIDNKELKFKRAS